MTPYGVGEVIYPKVGGSPCVGCGHASDVHRYVVVSDKKMQPTGCDEPNTDSHCRCPRYRDGTRADGPPSREETWANFPNDAMSILNPIDSPATRCSQPLCRAPIWWGTTAANNRRCPFDIKPDGTRTACSHWRTCADRPVQSKKARS